MNKIRISNIEIRNKLEMEIEENKAKEYDLEKRTFQFAQSTRLLVGKLTRNISNIEDCKQVTRSSGSIGANYIEANEALSKKDFQMRIKISRKEAKETTYWLKLLNSDFNKQFEKEIKTLIQESIELMMIFSTIMRKTA